MLIFTLFLIAIFGAALFKTYVFGDSPVGLEAYINSKNPVSTADIENFTKEYMYKKQNTLA